LVDLCAETGVRLADATRHASFNKLERFEPRPAVEIT
jgi:hypothetical protein